ncbi:MAG: hypothetical protein R2941_23325 [Desulfobacterales bacterium]
MTDRKTFDSPWKEILGAYFREFMLFFFPKIEKEIDWEKGYVPLDKELHQITRESDTGNRIADRLMRVWKKNGDETWVMAHTEIQGGKEENFPHRVFVYNYRGQDLYGRPVVSLAVLTDENPKWKVSRYAQDLWGCSTKFSFPCVKLLDYRKKRKQLEVSQNPFAVAVMAHLKTLETRKDKQSRLNYKLALSKNLYRHGWTKDDIIRLYRFIDWIMVLPAEMENIYHEKLMEYEREVNMQYITTAERIGMEKGMEKGILLGSLQTVLEMKFGDRWLEIYPKIKRIKKKDRLEKILQTAKSAKSAEEVLNAVKEKKKKESVSE